MTGKTLNPRRSPADFSKLAPAQAPDAVIVGCADSRVPPEILFDQGVGDLFVIRVAGNVVSGAGPTVKGSIAYAVVVLGAPLVMVLGHSQCGAVKAALETKELAAARVDSGSGRHGEYGWRERPGPGNCGKRACRRREAEESGAHPDPLRRDEADQSGRRGL